MTLSYRRVTYPAKALPGYAVMSCPDRTASGAAAPKQLAHRELQRVHYYARATGGNIGAEAPEDCRDGAFSYTSHTFLFLSSFQRVPQSGQWR